MNDEQIKENSATPTPGPLNQVASLPIEQSQKIDRDLSRWQRFKTWYLTHKKVSLPLTVLLLLLMLVALPWSRYQAAGIIVSKDLVVEVIDSTSHTPVSGAKVSAGSASAETDQNGKAMLSIGAGNQDISISKLYYEDYKATIFVPILKNPPTANVNLTATGRQAKITVKNFVTQQVLGNVDIKVAGFTAKTEEDGTAVVVLPANATNQEATLNLEGYNEAKAQIKASDSEIVENSASMTPVGKVYFLNKPKGKINMVKSDLDGSNKKTVVAGTGYERDDQTYILPSPDSKYVLLVTRRTKDYATPQMHILSTDDDKLLGVDNGNANFIPIGWSGDNLIYYSSRQGVKDWTTGRNKLKSYEASTGKITQLDQTSADGDSAAYTYENYAFIMIADKKIYYAKNWSSSDNSEGEEMLESKANTLSIIERDGQNHKEITTFTATEYIQYTRPGPATVYIWRHISDTSNKFYKLSVGSTAIKSADLEESDFYDWGEIFLPAPSGLKMLWVEHENGKHTDIVSDVDGGNPKSIASASKYVPYAWQTNKYILLSKGGEELFIMDALGGDPVKVTDYHPTLHIEY